MICGDDLVVPDLTTESSTADVVRAALGGAVRAFADAEASARSACAPDAIHRARVALRRLRSDLRTFAPVLDRAWLDAARMQVGCVAPAFSAARDADVLLTRVERDIRKLPDLERERAAMVLHLVRGVRDAAYRQLGVRLREPHYLRARDELVAAIRTPSFAAAAAQPARAVETLVMEPVWQRLQHAVRRRTRPTSDDELHRIRIKVKRVRYAAEALVAIGGPHAQRFAACAARLQTVLGDHRDATAACTHLQRELGGGDGAFVSSAIAELEREAAERARRHWKRCWRDLRHCARFWR